MLIYIYYKGFKIKENINKFSVIQMVNSLSSSVKKNKNLTLNLFCFKFAKNQLQYCYTFEQLN